MAQRFKRTSKEVPSPVFKSAQTAPLTVTTEFSECSEGYAEDEDKKETSAFPLNGSVHCEGLEEDRSFWKTFIDVRCLGKGHFAKVEHIKHRETSEEFAAKILDKTLDDNDVEELVREFTVLKSLIHPNIIRLHAAYESPRTLYLVTELATGGELVQRLGQVDVEVYSEDAMRRHMRRIIEAVQYMHAKNVAHRDIKPENVLLSDATDLSTIKIVDLGLSRFFDASKPMRTICGTHKYLAPELVQCDRGMVTGYDKAIDMWGVGLLAYIMLYGSNPFARGSMRDTHNAILRCSWSFPDGYSVSDEAQKLISGLLVKAPSQRLTADAALRTSWFSPTMPASPSSLMTSEPSRSVKDKLSEFNKERLLSKALKGAYRRIVSPRNAAVSAKATPRSSMAAA